MHVSRCVTPYKRNLHSLSPLIYYLCERQIQFFISSCCNLVTLRSNKFVKCDSDLTTI